MTEALLEAFAVLFVTIGPIDNAAMFSALTAGTDASYRRRMAVKSVVIATGIILVFAVFGDDILRFFGIHISSLEIAGGILLLIVALQMVMKDEAGSDADAKPGDHEKDIAVFPLAMPLIAGPDALVAVVLQISRARGDWPLEAAIIGVTLGVLALVFVAFLASGALVRVMGKQGIEVFSRVLGVLLAALSIEFIIDGIHNSVLFTDASE